MVRQKCDNVFFVYIDWTLEDLPRAFYVGKGQLVRVQEQERDNDHWRNIAAKHGFRREVILATKDESYAFVQEILGILEHGTFCESTQYRWGANKTGGGDGVVGLLHSALTKAKMSESHKGKKHSTATKDKISAALVGIPLPDATKMKMSASCKNRPGHSQSEETRARISASRKGQAPWSKGKKFSTEHKAKIRDATSRQWAAKREITTET